METINQTIPSRSAPFIIGTGGLTSNSGKTTLLCELLHLFPGWEAIKTTRGHSRSCGKDPQACCVSHLLGDQPLIRSGKDETYSLGKDTGRYWDAGAANVHWVIGNDEQIEKGICEALNRVRAPGVFVEGNSFSAFVKVDAMVMMAGVNIRNLKTSASQALLKSEALVLTAANFEPVAASEVSQFTDWLKSRPAFATAALPRIYAWQDRDKALERIRQVTVSIET